MKVLFVFASLICCSFATENKICLGPNGGGLQSLLDKMGEILPKKEIGEYCQDALASDENVRIVFRYLNSLEFYQQFYKLLFQKEVQEFLTYVCEVLHVNVGQLIMATHEFYEQWQKAQQDDFDYELEVDGFDEFLKDLFEFLPPDEVKPLIEELADDIDFKDSVEHLNSSEFKVIAEAVNRNRVYVQLQNELSKIGFHVDQLIGNIIKYIQELDLK